jgi:hypothetical protein
MIDFLNYSYGFSISGRIFMRIVYHFKLNKKRPRNYSLGVLIRTLALRAFFLLQRDFL